MGSKFIHLATLITILVCTHGQAEARVFNLHEEKVSSYFKGSYGQHGLGSSLYEGTEPGSASVSLDSTNSPYLMSGEVGFMLTYERFSLRIAGEYLSTMSSGATAEDASGVELYSIGSQVTALIPKVGLDLHLRQWSTSRLILSLEAGLATATLKNNFALTDAGETALGASDFTEQATTSGLTYEVRIGFETLFTDTTTFHVDLGYRQFELDGFETSAAYDDFSGPVPKGSKLSTSDGTPRDLNLDGLSVGIGFKFYL